MKTYRQKSRAGQTSQVPTTAKAPDEDKIKAILDRTGYTLDVTTGQRKYGGPPPNWEKPTPGNGCEVRKSFLTITLFLNDLLTKRKTAELPRQVKNWMQWKFKKMLLLL